MYFLSNKNLCVFFAFKQKRELNFPTQKNDILKYHIFIEKYHILFMTFIRYQLDIEK